MHLYRATLAATFGRGTGRPYQSALIRLSLLLGCCGLLGWLFASQLPALPSGQNKLIVVGAGIMVVQTAVMLALLTSYGMLRPNRIDILAKLLLCLPVKASQAWLALVLPGLVLTAASILLVAPSLIQLNAQFGVNQAVVILSLLLGPASILGIMYGMPARPVLLPALACACFLGVEYILLRHLQTSLDHVHIGSLIAWILLGAGSIILLWRSRYYLIKEAARSKPHQRVWLTYMPTRLWFVKKIWRNPLTSTGLVITLVLSSLIAACLWRLGFIEPSLAGGVLSLLTAAFAADVRALSVRRHPWEIAGYRGVIHFMFKQVGGTLSLSLLATLPLTYACLASKGSLPTMQMLSELGLSVALGLASGICATSLIAPGPRDISAQCMATLLATGILLLPEVSLFSQLSGFLLDLVKIGLVAGLLVVACYLEYSRNPYTWRKVHDPR